jgi:hypothetical protein
MQARTLPARHGVLWLIGGLQIFRRNPPMLTGLTFTYLLLVIVLNLIPGIGPFLLPMLLPTLTAMLGNGCRALEAGRALTPAILSEGLSLQRIGMIRLGGLHLLGSTVLVLISLGFGSKFDLSDGMSETEAIDMLQELSILLLLASPLLMAFWFAPLLTLWDQVPAGKSVFFSFVASWRNWRPFAMYGLAVTVVGVMVPGLLLVLASLISQSLVSVLSVALRMLLLFVLAPTLIASVYLSYRDVFQTPPLDVLIDDE